MNSSFAVRRTVSNKVPRPSCVAAAVSRCAWTIGLIKITLGDDWVDIEPHLDQARERVRRLRAERDAQAPPGAPG